MKIVPALVLFAIGLGAGFAGARALGSGAPAVASVGPEADPASLCKDPGLPHDDPRMMLEDPKVFDAIDAGLRKLRPEMYPVWRSCLQQSVRSCALQSTLAMAAANGSADACLVLPDDMARGCADDYVMYLAASRADPAPCERMRGSARFDQCRREALSRHKVDSDFGITCDTITDPKERTACRVRIFTEKVRREGRVKTCETLSDRELREACVWQLGSWIDGQGVAACEGMENGEGLRDICLLFGLNGVVRRSGDPKECDAIEGAGLRTDCASNAVIGRAVNAASLAECEKLEVPLRREECVSQVRVKLAGTNTDVTACLQLTDDGPRASCIDSAIRRQAVAQKNVKTCDGIANADDRRRCVDEVSRLAP
jgi:hypothetical protein